MDLPDKLDIILDAIADLRKRVAADDPPNEIQEFMTEGVIMGIDMVERIVRGVRDGEETGGS